MAIGEFGGAPAATGDAGPMLAAPYYWLYEMSHAALEPARALSDATRLFFRNPANPLSYTPYGKALAAASELFERSTRRYGKPDWNIKSTTVVGEQVPVHIAAIWQRPFCRLLHFQRSFEHMPHRPQPRLGESGPYGSQEIPPGIGVGRGKHEDGDQHDTHVEREDAPRSRWTDPEAEDRKGHHQDQYRLDEAGAQESHRLTSGSTRTPRGPCTPLRSGSDRWSGA